MSDRSRESDGAIWEQIPPASGFTSRKSPQCPERLGINGVGVEFPQYSIPSALTCGVENSTPTPFILAREEPICFSMKLTHVEGQEVVIVTSRGMPVSGSFARLDEGQEVLAFLLRCGIE